MRLDRGATGFCGPGGEPANETDLTLFRSACWEAARRIGGRVGELPPAGASSFHSAAITSRAEGLVVLCHAHLPVVAFTELRPVPGQPLTRFVNPPPWADAFTAFGFRCLQVEDLSLPMSTVDVAELAEAELTQIRYWRPQSLGDLVFNWWD
ncbi:hypothetical protein LUX01_06410 [Streptomyces sudanensis]|uniref:hypothetical protein n=1 Tax=Streptomyces sudanensis TaxID=436397 RepID=UPI0020CD7A9F|nr:hypothetical protein [Streptomyces sudanensis]MCP9986382.1 hypothetical protein [Streptomyces sudanensis]